MADIKSRCAVNIPGVKKPVEIRDFTVRAPDPGCVTIKVEYSGVCGTDPHIWKNDLPLNFPMIFGHEGIGTIEALHSSVTTDHASQPLQMGDRVLWTPIRPCHGCYECLVALDSTGCPNSFFMHDFDACARDGTGTWATYTSFASAGPRNPFFKVHPDVPSEAYIALGCALPTVVCATEKLEGGGIPPRANIVVQGGGAVGLAAIMLSKLAAARRVVCLEANPLRMAKAREFGADECLDITKTTAEERRARIAEIMGPRGVQLIIECSGHMSAVEEGLPLLAKSGKYLFIGTWAGKGTIPLDPFMVVNKAITIQGSVYFTARDVYNASQIVEQNYKRFPLASCVTHKFKLDDTQKGFERVLRGEAVKAVIVPNDT